MARDLVKLGAHEMLEVAKMRLYNLSVEKTRILPPAIKTIKLNE